MGRRERVAIGNGTGQIELVYSEKETWLGSVSSDVALSLKKSGLIRAERVALKMLDDYCCDIPHNNVLIKIDVEGYEREVIQGASKLLRSRKPKVIFESNDAKSRGELYRLLAENEYSVHELPWQPSVGSRVLDLRELLNERGEKLHCNFPLTVHKLARTISRHAMRSISEQLLRSPHPDPTVDGGGGRMVPPFVLPGAPSRQRIELRCEAAKRRATRQRWRERQRDHDASQRAA